MQCARPNNQTTNFGGSWIACSEKLPNASEYVLYCTSQYQALGKREREKWYRSAFSLEPEENQVICWRPIFGN